MTQVIRPSKFFLEKYASTFQPLSRRGEGMGRIERRPAGARHHHIPLDALNLFLLFSTLLPSFISPIMAGDLHWWPHFSTHLWVCAPCLVSCGIKRWDLFPHPLHELGHVTRVASRMHWGLWRAASKPRPQLSAGTVPLPQRKAQAGLQQDERWSGRLRVLPTEAVLD